MEPFRNIFMGFQTGLFVGLTSAAIREGEEALSWSYGTVAFLWVCAVAWSLKTYYKESVV